MATDVVVVVVVDVDVAEDVGVFVDDVVATGGDTTVNSDCFTLGMDTYIVISITTPIEVRTSPANVTHGEIFDELKPAFRCCKAWSLKGINK